MIDPGLITSSLVALISQIAFTTFILYLLGILQEIRK